MITEERVMATLANSNPVPDIENIDLVQVGSASYLATLGQRSSEVTQLSTEKQKTPKPNRTSIGWLAAAFVVVVVGVAILILNQGVEETPPATEVVSTTLAQSTSTTVIESALADIPVWLGLGNGQWTPVKSAIPFAFTNDDSWNSTNQLLTEERFSICPPLPGGGAGSICNLASVSVLFLDYGTIEETRDFLASFEGAELGEEQPITIDSASGISFEFTHDVPANVGQAQGDLAVPAAVKSTATEQTPLGQGPLGRSVIFIVDVDGVVVTLAFQGDDTAQGAPQDGFNTYEESGLAIIDSIIWGNP